MCGITGYVNFERERPASDSVLRKMANTLCHRGPDGEGFFLHRNVALGHRRLAIIDLSTGDQPMFNDDRSITLIHNGEIYNYIELREELKALGHVFRTNSDTEVMIRAYEQWGTDCLAKFNGMWSFALWDEKKQRLFCSRDRLGEKPFHYSVCDGTFVFASEIKGLFAFGIPRVLNEEVLDAYLCFGYVPAPYSMFKGIQKLPPGHFLLVENGQVRTKTYWDVNFPDESHARRDEDNILQEFESLFVDSVRLRMRSDVPFGAFLSGGLDSSAVVATMSAHSREPVKTCTIGFDDPEFDERQLARLVAGKFHASHVERTVAPEDAEALMERVAWHFDEPFGDSSALPTYVVSKIARERVAVVLTGDGGDEVLSGYTIHQGEKFSSQFNRLPHLIRESVIPGALNVLESISAGRSKGTLQRAGRVVESANLSFVDRLESKQSCLTRAERESMLVRRDGIRPAREFIEEAIEPVRSRDNFTKLNYWLLKVSLADDMLCKVDRASMAHSLETRVPFLDHRIVELLASVSMDVKMKGYSRKHILRQTIGKQLPPGLLAAKKRGFNVPLRTWLAGDGGSVLEQRARKTTHAGLLSKEGVDAIIQRHASGGRDAGNAVWALGMLSYAL